MEKKVLRIIAVFLAGAKNKVFWLGEDVSKHFYWIAWPPMKWPILRTIRKILGFKIVKLDELRCESLARLDKAVEVWNRTGNINKIVIPDSYSPQRKKQIGEIAAKYLISKNIPKEKISVIGKSVGTMGKVDALMKHLYSTPYEKYDKIFIHSVTTDYNRDRVTAETRNQSKGWGLNVAVVSATVPQEKIKECLKDEMSYNWLARFIEKIERKGREKA